MLDTVFLVKDMKYEDIACCDECKGDEPEPRPDDEKVLKIMLGVVGVLVLFALVAGFIKLWNRRQKRIIKEQTITIKEREEENERILVTLR